MFVHRCRDTYLMSGSRSYFPCSCVAYALHVQIVALRYDMAPGAVMRLRKLEGYDIVFICDDSSSMGTFFVGAAWL
jgi:hypothetical protein